jgi:hypothetical protein
VAWQLAQWDEEEERGLCRCFRPATTKGVLEIDVCGLAEIGNSKERHVAHNLDRFGPQGA